MPFAKGGIGRLRPRDLCFDDNDEPAATFVFEKVDLPTKPNDAVPLVGFGLSGTAHTNEVGSLSLFVTTSGRCFVNVSFDDQLVRHRIERLRLLRALSAERPVDPGAG